MEHFLKRAAFVQLYFINSMLFFSGFCIKLHDSNSLAAFTPRNVKLYSFDEPPAGVYIAWDPPLNSKLLHKSSDLSRNVANAKNDVNATLNRLSVPLHHPTGSNSDPHPQYILNEDSHELTNTSHVSADLFEMNSTKNLTRIGDDQSKISVLENVIYDVYGFINNYIVFYRRQQDSDVKFVQVDSKQTWVFLENITANTPYEFYIHVSYSSRRQFNSSKHSFTLTGNHSLCRCNPIGTEGGHEICNLTNDQPCSCNSGFGGLFCDQCLPKHYMHKTKCMPCPCVSRFGSFNCRLVNHAPVCSCHFGYTGKKCEKCSNGYFSYYQMCAKCICNNNIDPNSPEICDPEIGACKHCLYNTSGFACNECLPGFAGDPIMHKNCTKRDSTESWWPRSLTNQPKASYPISLKVGLPLVFLFICIIIVILFLQRHRFYRKLQPFWTIELKDDHDSVNFSTNDGQDFGGALSGHDDMDFYVKHASQRRGMQYSTLKETM